MTSTMCTGMRMVRAWSEAVSSASLRACRSASDSSSSQTKSSLPLAGGASSAGSSAARSSVRSTSTSVRSASSGLPSRSGSSPSPALFVVAFLVPLADAAFFPPAALVPLAAVFLAVPLPEAAVDGFVAVLPAAVAVAAPSSPSAVTVAFLVELAPPAAAELERRVAISAAATYALSRRWLNGRPRARSSVAGVLGVVPDGSRPWALFHCNDEAGSGLRPDPP